MPRLLAPLSVIAVVAAFGGAQPAFAADQIDWGNVLGSPISFGDLDGQGGGTLATAGATDAQPWGVAIDSAAGRIYWGNNASNTAPISFANLDGSGGGDLNTTGATANAVEGVAVDPGGGRIYWANATPDSISFADLNGAGGGNLNITGATASTPDGVVVDPAAGRIYWANDSSNTTPISFANLDGSGGGNLNTTGATASGAEGVAIDAAAGRIYWANQGSNSTPISFANLDGSGGGNLNTAGATADGAFGVAIDPGAGRIYWINEHSNATPVSFANLDGSGGGNLPLAGVTADTPGFPVLLQTPSPAGAPTITGNSTVGATLSCSEGGWSPDLVESFLYRAPRSFSYAWTLNGTVIPGATATTLTASSAGQYGCQVTATNSAGSAVQASQGFTVASAPPPPAVATVTKRATIGDHRITLTIPVACVAPGSRLAARVTSSRRPVGRRARLTRIALFIDRGITHTRHVRRGGRTIALVSHSPNAIVHHAPVTVRLLIPRLRAVRHTLRATFSYTTTERRRGRRESVTIARTLTVRFDVC